MVLYLREEWLTCKIEWAYCFYDRTSSRLIFDIKCNNHIGTVIAVLLTKIYLPRVYFSAHPIPCTPCSSHPMYSGTPCLHTLVLRAYTLVLRAYTLVLHAYTLWYSVLTLWYSVLALWYSVLTLSNTTEGRPSLHQSGSTKRK